MSLSSYMSITPGLVTIHVYGTSYCGVCCAGQPGRPGEKGAPGLPGSSGEPGLDGRSGK